MRAVCLLPAVELLVHHDVEFWLQAFAQETGRSATDVVLPAFVEPGASYDSQFGRRNERLSRFNWLGQWIQALKVQSPQLRTWVLVVPTLPTLVNNVLAVRDQWDQPMHEACLLQPMMQPILTQILQELAALGADGVVFDLTDCYPNSTSNLYPASAGEQQPVLQSDDVRVATVGGEGSAVDPAQPRLQNSCFCRVCRPVLERAMHWDDATVWFREAEHNITRLMLRPTGRGASHIDLPQAWITQRDVGSLCELAIARSFVRPDDPWLRRDAGQLLEYAAVRSSMVAEGLAGFGRAAAAVGLRTAAMLSTVDFDITTQTTLAAMRRVSAADEYWIAGYDGSAADDGAVVTLLDRRAIYYHNALFLHLRRLMQYAGLRDEELLGSVLNAWHAVERKAGSTVGQVAVNGLMAGSDGFGVVPLQREQFVDFLRKEREAGRLVERTAVALLVQLGGSAPAGDEAGRRRTRRSGPYGA